MILKLEPVLSFLSGVRYLSHFCRPTYGACWWPGWLCPGQIWCRSAHDPLKTPIGSLLGIVYCLCCDKTMYQIWTKSSIPRRSYCDSNIWPDLMISKLCIAIWPISKTATATIHSEFASVQNRHVIVIDLLQNGWIAVGFNCAVGLYATNCLLNDS